MEVTALPSHSANATLSGSSVNFLVSGGQLYQAHASVLGLLLLGEIQVEIGVAASSLSKDPGTGFKSRHLANWPKRGLLACNYLTT